MARIAHGGFMHESNSFAPGLSTWEMFCTRGDRPPFSRGAEVPDNLRNASFATSGFLDVMEGKHELVPLVWGSVLAGPPVSREAYERMAGELVAALSRALPVDALYLDLHGAMVSEDFEDGEGELLRRVRACVGPDLPVVVSLDYHSNVTPAMVAHSDALVPYHTYPHVDRSNTGVRAARVLETILERGRPTGRALRKPRFLIPLNAQCTDFEPSKSIVAASGENTTGDVLTLAYLAGFPPSDLADCGPAIIAHAYTQAAADAAADALNAKVCGHEVDFAQPMLAPDEAVRKAMAIAARASRPVVIADTQDNPGAGGSADTTGMLEALVRCDAQGAVLCYLNDPEAAAAAHAAGVGASITVALGGKSGPEGVRPFQGTFRVAALAEGKMTGTGPMARGRRMDLGPMAALAIGGVTVVVTTRRMQAHDQAPLRHIGIDPTRQKILVLKSTVHFRADFEPIAETVLVALAPGAHLVDPAQFPYRRLRRGVRLRPLGPEFAGG